MKRDDRAPVGFGDEVSRRGRTRTANAFVMTETTPVAGGADVRLTPRRGHVVMPEVEVDAGEVIIHVRRDAGPRIGQRVMVGKRLVEVKARRWDNHGRLQVLDSITGAWLAVDQ